MVQLGQERTDHCSCIHARRRLMLFPASWLSYSYCGQPFCRAPSLIRGCNHVQGKLCLWAPHKMLCVLGHSRHTGTCVPTAGHQCKEAKQPCVALVLLSRVAILLQHDLKVMCQEMCLACSQGSSLQIWKEIHLPREAISIFMS